MPDKNLPTPKQRGQTKRSDGGRVPVSKDQRTQAPYSEQAKSKEASAKFAIAPQIKSPIAFFSLAAVIIEIVFGAVIVWSRFNQYLQFTAFLVMAGIFIYLIRTVAHLAEHSPGSLYEGLTSEAQLQLKLEELRHDVQAASEKTEQALDVSTAIGDTVSSPGFQSGIRQIVRDEMQRVSRALPGGEENEE